MALLCLLPKNLQHKNLLLSFQFWDVRCPVKKGEGGGMGTKPNTKVHFIVLAATMPMAAAGDGT